MTIDGINAMAYKKDFGKVDLIHLEFEHAVKHHINVLL